MKVCLQLQWSGSQSLVATNDLSINMTTSRKYICPSCKAKEGVNIIYGMPSPELFEMAERNEVVLGGCVMTEDQPERRCLLCSHEWLIKRRQ